MSNYQTPGQPSAATLYGIVSALETCLFGHSGPGPLKQRVARVEACISNAPQNPGNQTLVARLDALLVATIAVPPVVEFHPDGDTSQVLLLSFAPFCVTGIFYRAAALEALRPYKAALGTKRLGAELDRAALLALVLPRYRKPLAPEETRASPDDYRSEVPGKIPRELGVNLRELVVAAEKPGGEMARLIKTIFPPPT